MATKPSGREAREKPAKEAAAASQAPESNEKQLCTAVNDVGLKLQGTIAESAARAQQSEAEARMDYVREVQQAEFDKAKADHDAYVAYVQADLGDAEAENGSEGVRRLADAQRAAFDRHVDTQKRIADAGAAYQQAVDEARAAHAEDLAGAHREHLAQLKSLWDGVDPASVDPGDLAMLGQMTLAASQASVFAPPPPERRQ